MGGEHVTKGDTLEKGGRSHVSLHLTVSHSLKGKNHVKGAEGKISNAHTGQGFSFLLPLAKSKNHNSWGFKGDYLKGFCLSRETKVILA